MKQPVLFKDLGKDQSYQYIWNLQESILQQNSQIKAAARGLGSEGNNEIVSNRSTTNHLLFVEHKPVYTLGKSGDISHVLISEDDRQKKVLIFLR